ncbi:hypothetical protein WIS52_14035 [Pseudonocardia nematodicida]|uniref:TNase-like domain-containing protein n=1 Tax=Pseudonocardia nematodicida TaxID=1206997 RepID=A0ABV1KAU4_9PSEU
MLPEPRHRARTLISSWSTGPRRVVAALAVAALVAAGLVAGLMMARGGEPPAAAGEAPPAENAALGAVTGPPTLIGRVQEVVDPATVVVEVQGRPVTVSVIGVDISATPECARADALAFARQFLDGQEVTLVPDPTLPEPAPEATVWPAYLVLPSQQSYTDAALTAGWVSPGDGRYRPGFETGQRIAQDENAGMWGPPCNRAS